MRINVNNCVRVAIEGRNVDLMARKNPHEVPNDQARDLIEKRLATPARGAGRSNPASSPATGAGKPGAGDKSGTNGTPDNDGGSTGPDDAGKAEGGNTGGNGKGAK